MKSHTTFEGNEIIVYEEALSSNINLVQSSFVEILVRLWRMAEREVIWIRKTLHVWIEKCAFLFQIIFFFYIYVKNQAKILACAAFFHVISHLEVLGWLSINKMRAHAVINWNPTSCCSIACIYYYGNIKTLWCFVILLPCCGYQG